MSVISDMESHLLEFDKPFSGHNPIVNVVELGKSIKRKRESSKLSLRAVAEQARVSASTLSRIENGSGVPDAPTLARLSIWLDIPIDSIIESADNISSSVVSARSTPDFVEARLRADRKLTPEKARALAELFRIAYDQVTLPK